MTIEINGMAHVILTVSRFEVAREFYRKLLPEFGMKPVFDGDKLFYCVGARTAIGIEPCDPALTGERFVQRRVGLLFEDPDGIRLEVNFVPGAGLLADGAHFNPATGYV